MGTECQQLVRTWYPSAEGLENELRVVRPHLSISSAIILRSRRGGCVDHKFLIHLTPSFDDAARNAVEKPVLQRKGVADILYRIPPARKRKAGTGRRFLALVVNHRAAIQRFGTW